MLQRYLPAFQQLTPDETGHVVTRLLQRGHELPATTDGLTLFNLCEARGMMQSDIVLSMSRDSTQLGVASLEKLVGRPLRRVPELPAIDAPHKTPNKPGPKQVRARTARVDNRVITSVAKNPKKEGSAAWKRYKLYKVGQTLDGSVQAGVTRADIRWDLAQGFIKVRSAKKGGR